MRAAVEALLHAGWRTPDLARGRGDRVLGTREAGDKVLEVLV